MISEVCKYVHNYFAYKRLIGTFEIKDGKFADNLMIKENQYFRIVGSLFNDGVYKYDDSLELQDELFKGGVWLMAVPKDFEKLCNDIEKFERDNEPSVYTSESFAGYSYSKATNSKGQPVTWHDVFAKRLNAYRKLRELP